MIPAALSLVVMLAGVLRFYGLAWGAPYFHFHIDEHFVFVGADRLRVSMEAAAMSGKFFMYGPLPMHLLNAVVWVYEGIKAPLALTVFQDQVTYMVMGRAISAAMGTATVLVVYFVGKRVSTPIGGLLAAALLATTVVHIAESHSFRVDLAMLFFVSLAWLFALRIADQGRWRDYLWAGVFSGAAIGSEYSAAFILGVVAVAHLAAPRRPRTWVDVRGWLAWTARGLSPLAMTALAFAIINPMAFLYYHKFRQDIVEQIVNPLTGGSKPIWIAQFSDVQPQLYWFTTNLWWGFGPTLEVWGLLGIAWLVWRPTRPKIVAAAFPLIYFLTAGGTTAPMARYALPLAPAFAVAAGAFSAFLLDRPRWRTSGHRRDRRGRGHHSFLCVRLHEHLQIARCASGGVGLPRVECAGRIAHPRRAVTWHSSNRRLPAQSRLSWRPRAVGGRAGTARLLLAVHARCLCLPVWPPGDAGAEA